MKSKRVLELKEFEEQHKQRKLEFEKAASDRIEHLRSEIEKVELAFHRYVEQEFEHYVKTYSALVNKVDGGTPGSYVYVVFSNDCCLHIPPRGGEMDASLLWKRCEYIIMSRKEQKSVTWVDRLLPDKVFNERLVACAEVFADACRLVREVVPCWFDKILPELDAELLMTARALRWVSKQVGGQWPDIVAGHVVDKFEY